MNLERITLKATNNKHLNNNAIKILRINVTTITTFICHIYLGRR